MDKMPSVVFLLDHLSRERMKSNISELAKYGFPIITSLTEITREVLEDSPVIVVLENYIASQEGFNNIQLYGRILKLSFLFLGTDSSLLELVSDLGTTVKTDTTDISYEKIRSIVTKDYVAIRRIESEEDDGILTRTARDLIKGEKVPSNIKRLAESYLGLFGSLRFVRRELSKAKESNDSLQLRVHALKERYQVVKGINQQLLEAAVEHNRNLKQYEVLFTRDVYEKILLSRYPSRPMIIYLKEYEELVYQNSFIVTLYNILRMQKQMSVKVIRLFDSNASMRLLSVPSYYSRVAKEFTVSDVVTPPYLVKVGAYKEVMDILLQNRSYLDVLIIVDSKSHMDTVISNATLSLALCKSEKRLINYGLDANSSIVNFGKGPLSWDYYSEIKELDEETRFAFLSSRPVFQHILEIIKNLGR